MKKTLLGLTVITIMTSCLSNSDNNLDITEQFKERWNINEDLQRNKDGSITYNAMAWGGMVANFTNDNAPTDWSGYEKIVFEFAEPTKVNTQIVINDRILSWGNTNINSMEGSFIGQDVSAVDRVALQAAEPTTLTIKRVYLATDEGMRYPTNLWDGQCVFGNYTNGFMISANKFDIANEGDILEFIYKTDKSNPSVNYWQIKTMPGGTNKTLEGNYSELNAWGCATVGGETSIHHIRLTANDVASLRECGLFVIGYYLTVTQCNLLQ